MNTLVEYERAAGAVPVSPRNDRIEFPVLGLQEEAGKIGSLLTKVFASGTFSHTEEQGEKVKDRFAGVLGYVARLSNETGIGMQEPATHIVAQLQAKTKELDPHQR